MPPPNTAFVYIVTDDPAACDALRRLLASVGLQTLTCADADGFLTAYRADQPGCLVLDAPASGCRPLMIPQRLRQQGIDLPVIIIAGQATVAMAVAALKQGVLDFIEKPFNDQALLDSVHHALTVDGAQWRVRMQRQEFLHRFDTLTAREQDVLRRVAQGLSNQDIAQDLGLSRKTVEVHRARVMQKMQAATLSHLIRMAMVVGILKSHPLERSV